MRRILLGLIMLLATCGMAQDDFHPQQSGYSWTYTNGETQTLGGPRDFGGQQVMVLTHWFQGDAISEDYLVYSADGVQHVGTAASGTVMTYNPPLRAYTPGPFQVGTNWQSTARLGDISITLSAEVLGMRGVETPAGRYNAWQVRQVTVTNTGAQTVLDAYFVPTVGVVRYVMQDGSIINLIEKNF